MINACCRAHRLLMSLSSLSSDSFSEHADWEALFKDVQSSRKVSMSLFAWFSTLSSSPVCHFQKRRVSRSSTKADPLSVPQSFPLLRWPFCLSADHWHFCTHSSATEKKNRWKVRMLLCCTKYYSQNPCTTFDSHPFTTTNFILWMNFQCSAFIILAQLWGRSCNFFLVVCDGHVHNEAVEPVFPPTYTYDSMKPYGKHWDYTWTTQGRILGGKFLIKANQGTIWLAEYLVLLGKCEQKKKEPAQI